LPRSAIGGPPPPTADTRMECAYFGTCGGCTLPGVPYAEQLAQKQARLSRLLGMPVPPLIPSPAESRFRNKVSFVFGQGPGGRGLVMGHYALGSNRIVAVDECPVHSSRGNRIAFALRDRLARANVSAAGPGLAGVLRHVVIRTTTDDRQAVAMLVVTRNDKSLRKPVKALLASDDRPDGLLVNIHDKPGPYMVGPETIKIEGHAQVREVVQPPHGDDAAESASALTATSFLVSPTTFFQTNVGAARELVRLVLEAARVNPGDRANHVLDLYSGSGLFALPLAKAGARVTAVEENRQAMQDAEANLRINRIVNGQVRLITARVEDALPRVTRDRWDVVVLDPPRQGCPLPVLAAVFKGIAPTRAVYVSCNPESLAQELPVILKAGYRVTRIQAVDMFPHTDHIETVVTVERR
jgi:23S rRNA (uracil1939-C5)-methyltransferase